MSDAKFTYSFMRKHSKGEKNMEYDFGIMLSDVTESGLITLEVGVRPSGNPVYRVSVFDGKHWKGARYSTFAAAQTTYKLLRRVI